MWQKYNSIFGHCQFLMIHSASSFQTDQNFNALMPLLARRSRAVVLLGMMGAGKSAMARQLAVLSGLGYVDADREIVRRAGMSIPRLFAEQGEAAFRALENQVITAQLERGAIFLALGGGAFINPVLRSLLLKKADCIYLDVPKEMLWRRISKNIAKRPMLDTDDPKATFEALYQQRAPMYAEAQMRVQVTSDHQMDTVILIRQVLWQYIEAEES